MIMIYFIVALFIVTTYELTMMQEHIDKSIDDIVNKAIEDMQEHN